MGASCLLFFVFTPTKRVDSHKLLGALLASPVHLTNVPVASRKVEPIQSRSRRQVVSDYATREEERGGRGVEYLLIIHVAIVE